MVTSTAEKRPRAPRVLLADDDTTVLTVITRYLEQHGFEVVAVRDGQEALSAFEEDPTDLVVLDANMPRLRGPAVVRALRAAGHEVPALLISEDALDPLDAPGVNLTLRKPFSLDALLDQIASLIGSALPDTASAGAEGPPAMAGRADRTTMDDFAVQLQGLGLRGVEASYELLDSAAIGMALLDPTGQIHWANAALVTLLGTARGDLLDRDIDSLIDPADAAAQRVALASVIRGERLSSVREARVLRRDHAAAWVSIVTTLAVDSRGRPLLVGPDRLPAVTLQVMDISERRLAEHALSEARSELQRRNTALERSNQELDDLALVLSHDLAEPLRVISGHVQLLAKAYSGDLDERADEWIGFAVDGCARMRQLIDAVLSYSRIDRIENQTALVETDVLVRNVISDLGEAVRDAQAVIVVESPLPVIETDPVRFSQVMSNLLSNALRHRNSSAHPHVVVRSEPTADGLRFEVIDDGPGIPPQHRDRIFQPFKRLAGPRDAGVGIGLATCRKVVTGMGGAIGVIDAPGPQGGALFWFTLPRSAT